MNEHHAVIIGGGISGLSAAFFLSQKISQEHLFPKITVLETKARFGGVLRTLSHERSHMEAGADAFYAGQSDALDLCRALGLQEELVEAAPCFRRFFILKGGRTFSIPILPDSFSEALRFFKSPLLSIFDKCRMLGEPFVPCRKEGGDENFKNFICRRFGQGFYQKIARPLIRGVYMTDPKNLSLKAMFQRLGEAERTRGSLAGFFLDKKKKDRPAEFLTLKNGLEAMVRALVRELGACEDWPSRPSERAGIVGIPACELRRLTTVRECVYDAGWKVVLDHGEILRADALCFAMNPCDAAKLLLTAAPDLSRELSTIRHDSIAAVNLIYKSTDIPARGLDFGFLVPASGECHPFSSLKWLGETADGSHLLLRAFISEAMLSEIFHENDETLKRRILSSLRELFGIEAAPQFVNVERYPDALPQYETGHLERVARIEKTAGQYPGLYLLGNGFRGFGITDCIRGAKNTAGQISRSFQRLVVASSCK